MLSSALRGVQISTTEIIKSKQSYNKREFY